MQPIFRTSQLFVAVISAVVATLCVSHAHAATITVYADDLVAPCRLRDAVEAANTDTAFNGCPAGSGADRIVLSNMPGYPFFSIRNPDGADENANETGDLDITSTITIEGSDPTGSVIVGPHFDRVFDVHAGASLTLRDVTVIGGSVVDAASNDGGVIRKASGASLAIFGSVLRDGRADVGGAIHASGSGTFVLRAVTLFANEARLGGALGLQLAASETAFLGNVTVSGNSATHWGGGIYASGPVRMRNVTVARNVADRGGGFIYAGTADTNTVNVANGVFVDNTDADGASDVACSNDNQLGSRAYTLIGALDGCSFASFAGLPGNIDARLTPLFDAGGGIPVHALMPGSAARDAGNPSASNALTACQATDARGVTRTFPCDLGAYEEHFDVIVNSFADLPDSNPGDGLCRATGNVCTLRALTMEARVSLGRWFAKLPTGSYAVNRAIAFEDVDGGDLDIEMDDDDEPLQLILFGTGDAGDTRIVGGGQDRVLEVRARERSGPGSDYRHRPLAFALLNATIEGGVLHRDPYDVDPNPVLAGGGVRITGGKTLLHNVVVRDNYAESLPMESSVYAGGMMIDVRLQSNETDRPYLTSAHLERFAVVDNATSGEGGGYGKFGGGLRVIGAGEYEIGDGVVLRNGVIAGNRSRAGGGLMLYGKVDASFLSIVDNVSGPLPVPDGTHAGGLVIGNQQNTLRGLLLARNRAGDAASDCGVHDTQSSFVSLGHNLIETVGPGCLVSGDATGNLMNIDAKLGERIEIGGMPVYVPLAASPALDATPRTHCADGHGIALVDDVLGQRRPAGAGCDIGAVEVIPPLFVDGFESAG